MEDMIYSGGNCAIPEGSEEFELYCCNNCGRLISKDDEARALKTGIVCSCGSVRYRPPKLVDALPNAAGDYVVTGRYGEQVTIAKDVFEEAFKPVEVAA
jgi:DNA-directed RNA polymerase subunit RPC12/RpoP